MQEIRIRELVEPILADHGLELDAVDITPLGRRKLLRITVDGDGPEGHGPLLDDISAASAAVSAALDASPAAGEAPFTLEVSSRGVSKPLTQAKHYRRNVGRLVRLTGPELDVTGRIVSAGEDVVELDVDGRNSSFQLADVAKAVVQVEMNPPKRTARNMEE